ncbi:hypothetical protein CS063_03750 [Sporanaerobium hydrogeniformans]|uniref:Uncharacterized protein n=1 Tax=Sporanaerobium hydrogeniformans TaxID=3072179 RepID=A0AC61DHA7_9FIRM|nr:AraC family transcriptional regulator [Sporanaerobium hydrogeniformans]PHV71687.1 hypothetical protein CS063_03750 [Sporanaerobium hydrogeniformans]
MIQEIDIHKISPYIRFINHFHCKGGEKLPQRIIYDYELIYCLQGKASIHYDNQDYSLEKGDLFYLKPHIPNSLFVSPHDQFEAHCVHFDWTLLDEQFNFTVEETYLNPQFALDNPQLYHQLVQRPSYQVSDFYMPILLKGLDEQFIAPYFKELYYTSKQQGVSRRIKERALFLEIISYIMQYRLTDHGVIKQHRHQSTISAAIDYMYTHYSEELTTYQLAQVIHLSPKYFGSLFLKITGKTVQTYLCEIRIEQAKKQLIETPYSIEQIALSVGFKDVFYFTKCFTKKEGISPGKYRNISNMIY